MSNTLKLHENEAHIDENLVKKLLSNQFPKFANLPLRLIFPQGTDNVMYQLGNDMIVRMPRIDSAANSLMKEKRWLPTLASRLPINIPNVIGVGNPDEIYPYPWIVGNFIEGKHLSNENKLDLNQAAIDLGNFVLSMQRVSTKDAPFCSRGKPLSTRDKDIREAIALIEDIYDIKLLTEIWEYFLQLPNWSKNPTWIHGDLHADNLLAENRKITAIVDFGMAGIGDPAVDLMVAWTLLNKEARKIFKDIVKPDQDTWERGKAWAFNFIVAYPYYKKSNPRFAQAAKKIVDEVIISYKEESNEK